MGDTSISVFLADDHALLREGMIAILSQDPDITVIGQCGDGLELLERVLTVRPDVVVLDISLPGMNGLDVCRHLQKQLPDTPILIVTMHSNEQCVTDAFQSGAAGYLLKDSASEEFCDAIRAVIAGKRYLGEGISRSVLDRLDTDGGDCYALLTKREREILPFVAEGLTNRQIAGKLHIAVKTVDTHRNHIMQKLDIHCQADLMKYALRRGILTIK